MNVTFEELLAGSERTYAVHETGANLGIDKAAHDQSLVRGQVAVDGAICA